MSVKAPSRLIDPTAPWIDQTGRPTVAFFQYLATLDRAVRALLPAGDIGAAVAFADLVDGTTAGETRFVSDGLKAGETTGSGTGVLAYWDGTRWIAVDTGSAVAD